MGECIFKESHGGAHDRSLDRAGTAEGEIDGDHQGKVKEVIRADDARQPGLKDQRSERNEDVNEEGIVANLQLTARVGTKHGHGWHS